MGKENKPVWNVYKYDVNRTKIYVFNVFDHGTFWNYVKKIFNTSADEMTREYFDKQLERELLFYFWSKCEHEIIITPWVGSDNAAIKVDIYTQVMNNWKHFSDYTWKWYSENWE